MPLPQEKTSRLGSGTSAPGGIATAARPLSAPPLDPRHSARDLLEDLLFGIHGCWLFHDEHDDRDGADNLGADGDENLDDEQAERHQDHSRERFAHLVRKTASPGRG
ncbi:hypothetical protein ACFV6D_22090 [Kitasatospora sp. NPDC059812]|uniref:hypothetical protein n=1 Tax=Kitasatospora sp. NPDC059812 TaxID=3346958 RepID=UPI003653D7F4